MSVDGGLDGVSELFILSVVGALAVERWHLACAKLACGFFPDRDLGGEVPKKGLFEIGVTFAIGALMAVDAVFFKLWKPLFLGPGSFEGSSAT